MGDEVEGVRVFFKSFETTCKRYIHPLSGI